ncbi:Ff.00g008680.m01.CDS01 [Fusarium sp. VM40]|nr:Ff.00g008680.m01.CDS01 [Fusarium sp. VM40]
MKEDPDLVVVSTRRSIYVRTQSKLAATPPDLHIYDTFQQPFTTPSITNTTDVAMKDALFNTEKHHSNPVFDFWLYIFEHGTLPIEVLRHLPYMNMSLMDLTTRNNTARKYWLDK